MGFKIENFSKSVRINNFEFSNNTLSIETLGDEIILKNGKVTVARGNISEFLTSSNIPYSSVESLSIDFRESFSFVEEMNVDFESDITSASSGQQIIFTDLSDNNPTRWCWDFGDGNTSTDQNPIHIYAAPGVYTVTLLAAKSTVGGMESKTAFITILGSIFDNALQFDGVNDFVSVPFTGANSSSKMTISMWARKTGGAPINIVYGSSISITNGFWVTWFTDNVIYLSFRNGGFNSASIAKALDTNWHHFFVVYDGTESANEDRLKLWLDGTQQTLTQSGTHPTSLSLTASNDLNVGKLSPSNFSNAVYDELAHWVGVAGINEDAVALYNGGVGQLANNVIPFPDVYYRFNGTGTDTIAFDSSGNGRDGTLNNFTGTYWVEH